MTVIAKALGLFFVFAIFILFAACGPSIRSSLLPEQSKEQPKQDQVLNGMRIEDFALAGELTPTVYFKPIIEDADDRCAKEERIALKTKEEQELLQLCKLDYAQCALQGSCQIHRVKDSGKEILNVNFHSRTAEGSPRFFLFDLKVCAYGFGMKGICLDPMYSIAADPEFHKPGDVIFVPAIAGLKLSESEIHNGYFVVRDRGAKIKGAHRFDFYSGFVSWRSDTNPFKTAGLADKKNSFKYFKVTGESALVFSKLRAFPKVP
jgi:hypothetical protein